MITPTPKTCLVTHRGCLDGTGSALMFIWAGGSQDKIVFRNPSGLIFQPGELPDGVDEVWYADCCPPDLTDPCCGLPFAVFDHHISNERKFGGDSHCTFDMAKSGTSLMAYALGIGSRHPHPGFSDPEDADADRLIKALEAYDLGRFDEPDGMFLADLATTFSQEHMLGMLVAHGAGIFDSQTMQARVEAARSVRTLYADSASRSARITTLDGHRVALASSPVYWKNEVAERLLNAGAEVAIIFDVTGGMVSLRSRPGGPDCSLIASKYGGGGHARAAGFKASSHPMLNAMFNEVFG